MGNVASRRRTCVLTAVSLVLLSVAGGADGVVPRAPLAVEEADTDTSVVLVRGPWGSAPGQFGKSDEASRPGPMDFAVVHDTLYVLDPVNARVQLFNLDGSYRGEIPIGTRTADFLGVDALGRVIVLDAFVRRELKAFSVTGELLAQATLPASIGLCSAVFSDRGRVWVEERHDRVYELDMDRAEGRAPARIVGSREGRPLGAEGTTLHARKDGTHTVVIETRGAGQTGEPIFLQFPRPVASIVALEADESGRVYLAAACQRRASDDPWKTDIVLVAIGPDGEVAGTVRMPNTYVTDHYRKLCVSDTGEIIQMQTTEQEVRFVRWTLPSHQDERPSP
jgi:hypothetical protein